MLHSVRRGIDVQRRVLGRRMLDAVRSGREMLVLELLELHVHGRGLPEVAGYFVFA